MNKEEELIRKKSPVNIRNRKASFEYFFIETFTAGIVLTGTEIKSIRLGKASLVEAMALAAAAAGADGLMIEVHNNPEKALCDGPQSLLPETFAKLVKKIEKVRAAIA